MRDLACASLCNFFFATTHRTFSQSVLYTIYTYICDDGDRASECVYVCVFVCVVVIDNAMYISISMSIQIVLYLNASFRVWWCCHLARCWYLSYQFVGTVYFTSLFINQSSRLAIWLLTRYYTHFFLSNIVYRHFFFVCVPVSLWDSIKSPSKSELKNFYAHFFDYTQVLFFFHSIHEQTFFILVFRHFSSTNNSNAIVHQRCVVHLFMSSALSLYFGELSNNLI